MIIRWTLLGCDKEALPCTCRPASSFFQDGKGLVFGDDCLDLSFLDPFQHGLKIRPVEVRAAPSVVHEKAVVQDVMITRHNDDFSYVGCHEFGVR